MLRAIRFYGLALVTAAVFMLVLTVYAEATPTSALWTTDPQYVFSCWGLKSATAQIIIMVKDENGQAVPAGTPIMVSIDRGLLTGNTLFKKEVGSDFDSWGGGLFYFRTEDGGKIQASYIPRWLPTGEEEVQPHYLSSVSLLQKVAFTDPANDSTAYGDGGIDLEPGSTIPILVGLGRVIITTTGVHGDKYIFSASGMLNPEEAEINILVKDGKGRPVPAGTPIGIEIFPGVLKSNATFNTDTTSSNYFPGDGIPTSDWNAYLPSVEYGRYFLRTDPNGKIRATYRATNSLPPPFTWWKAHRRTPEVADLTKLTDEEAWRIYSEEYSPLSDIGGVAFDSNGNPVSLARSVTEGRLVIDSLSTLPVLIGPDKVKVTTVGPYGDYYVFTSSSVWERAILNIEVWDSKGRPVPWGTPISVRTSYPGAYPSGFPARVFGLDVFGSYIPGYYFLRVRGKGKVQVRFEPSPVDISPVSFVLSYYGKTMEEYDVDRTNMYPGIYPVLLDFYERGEFTVADPRGVLDEPSTITTDTTSTFPVIIGPDIATVVFVSPALGPWEVESKVEIYVKDFAGYPVPYGTPLDLRVSDGWIGLGGEGASIREEVSEGGKITTYFYSPTRPVWADWSIKLDVIVPNTGRVVIGSDSISLLGPAVNFADFSVSKLLIGISEKQIIEGVISPLLFPLRLRALAETGQEVAARRRSLLMRISSGEASPEDFEQYRQSWLRFGRGVGELVPDAVTLITLPLDLTGAGTELYEGALAEYGVKRIIIKESKKELLKESVKESVKQEIEEKSAENLPVHKIAHLSRITTSAVELRSVQVDDAIRVIRARTGMFELFGLKFRVEGTGGYVADGTVEVGDQAPLPLDFLPPELSFYISPNRDAVTAGILEVTGVDPGRDALEGVAVGLVFQDPTEFALIPFTAQIDSAGGGFAGGDGSRVEVPAGALSEPTELFWMEIPPPAPTSGLEEGFIASAYALGSVVVGADTTIQKVTFEVPVELSLVYSQEELQGFDEPRPHPYAFDEAQGQWVPLKETGTVSPDTVRFVVSGTGIFGLGGKVVVSPVVSVEETDSQRLPLSFHLYNNFPNPFNATTVIRYTLPEPSEVHLTIYDILGRKVRTLVEDHQQPGMYRAVWDGRDNRGRPVGSGVYLYKLQTGDKVKARRMVLLR